MRIGLGREFRSDEQRVALTPAGVKSLVSDGHEVVVESGAGVASGYADSVYRQVGARISHDQQEVLNSPILVSLGISQCFEPVAGQCVMAFYHQRLRSDVLNVYEKRSATVIALDRVRDANDNRTLLAVMSRLAGQRAVSAVVKWLARSDRETVSWGATPGRLPIHLVVFGGGPAGTSAAWLGQSLGAKITMVEPNRRLHPILTGHGLEVLDDLELFPAVLRTADGVICAAVGDDGSPPAVLTRSLLSNLSDGSVVVDLAVTDGGSVEGLRPTTLANPVQMLDGEVVGIAVPNWASMSPQSASQGLTTYLMPVVRRVARWGVSEAYRRYPGIAAGTQVLEGEFVGRPPLRMPEEVRS